MQKPSIAIIGNCYFDEIYTIGTFPEPDQKILASDLVIVLGGSASNTSCGLVKLGYDAYLFSVMGNDEDSYRLFRAIREKGINPQYINHVEGQSGRTIILLDESKSSTKIGYQGVCSDMSQTLMYEGLRNPMLSHIHLASVSARTIEKALEYKKNQTISLDFGAKTQQAEPDHILALMEQMDLVFLNRVIYNKLFDTPVEKLEEVQVPYTLIVTAGTEGIYGKFEGKVYHHDIIPTEVVDTTGAGDAVSAAVIHAFLQEKEPMEILRIGVTAASIKIKHFGGSNGHANRKDLQ